MPPTTPPDTAAAATRTPTARLRAAPGATASLALLVLVSAFVLAALPRALDAYASGALRQALARAQPADRLLSASAPARPADEYAPEDGSRLVSPSVVAAADRALAATAGPPLVPDRHDAAYGVRNATPATATVAAPPRAPADRPPRATLLAQSRLAQRARPVAGRLPHGGVTGPPGDQRVEAALTTRTARTVGLTAGDTFRVAAAPGHLTVRVTGLVEPRGAGRGAYWGAEQGLAHAALVSEPPEGPGERPHRHWLFAALLPPSAAPALLGLEDGAQLYWRHPPAPAALRADRVPALRAALTSLDVGADSVRLERRAGVGDITLDDGLAGVLRGYAAGQATVAPLLLIARLGLGTVALAVLVLAGVLAAEQRRAELDLLRSRGASLPGLFGRLLAETAAAGLPAGAAGAALALLCTPGGRTGPALLSAGAATAVAVLALPLRAALAHRGPRAAADRADVLRARPSRRRTVAEATVLVLALGAVVALRQRGAGGAGPGDGGADPLLAAAPVLLALSAALLLHRCRPLPLRLLARLAARRRGPVAFLGLARAGRARAGAAAVLPLVALLVALTVASFGGMVLAGVADGRDAAALRAVGADVRIEAPGLDRLPDGFAARVRAVRGVDGVAAFRLSADGKVVVGGENVTVALVDPASYSALAARTGRGAFPAGALATRARHGPVPALASPGVAGHFASRTGGAVGLPGLHLPLRTALVRRETPAVPGGEFLVVSRDAVARTRPGTRGTGLLAPNALLATGRSADPAALRALTRGGAYGLTLLRTERARYDDPAVQSGAERLYLAAVLAACGFSLLAVGLDLAGAAPERLRELARLRALALGRRQGQGVLLVESLPLHLSTAVAGVLTGLAAAGLLGPGIDLGALAGTADGVPVRPVPDPAALLAPPSALLVLTAAGLLVQAGRAARRTADLRWELP